MSILKSLLKKPQPPYQEDNHINDVGVNNIIVHENTNLDSTTINLNGNDNDLSLNNTQLTNTSIKISGNNNSISFGKNVNLINAEIHISGNNHKLIIDDGVQVYGRIVLWFEDNHNKITIGKYTTIGSANISIAEPNSKISIGSDCMIANNVTIKNSDFHSIIDLETNNRINPAGDVYIGNHVWLGENTHILKNVVINDNSIIALGAVVTKSVPNNSIAAGIPAKVIKQNTTWNRHRI